MFSTVIKETINNFNGRMNSFLSVVHVCSDFLIKNENELKVTRLIVSGGFNKRELYTLNSVSSYIYVFEYLSGDANLIKLLPGGTVR